MKTKLSYPLFFLCAVLAFFPFVFLPLNALWLVFKSLVWFGAGKGREEYAAEVWDRTPLAGLSIGFLVLTVFLLISLFVPLLIAIVLEKIKLHRWVFRPFVKKQK